MELFNDLLNYNNTDSFTCVCFIVSVKTVPESSYMADYETYETEAVYDEMDKQPHCKKGEFSMCYFQI